jgi:hypothetical protein
MQIPIDFNVALNEAGTVIIVILVVSLMIFAIRVREIYSDIGVGTRRALMAYAMSGVAMAIATEVGVQPELRFLITGTGAFFLGAIVIAEVWILLSEKRAMESSIITALIIAGVYANNFLEEFFGFTLVPAYIGLTILLLASLYLALVLLRENPSTFSASLLIVLVLYMATWVIAATNWTFSNPQYYIVQVIPLIMAATVFSSIRRPWRSMLAAFIMLFTTTLGIPLLTTSYAAGSWTIFYFVGVEIFATFCLIAPLNFFLDSATETGSKMPLYLGAVVALVALLVSTHALSWAVFISTPGMVWNQYIVWVDVLIGSCAIIAFMLAAVSSLFDDWALIFTREVMVIFGTAAAFLTFPLTQPSFITNDVVWLAIGVVIAIGTLMFIRLSIRIARAGGGSAALRLMMFIVSALMIAIVSMYSDNIPPVPPAVPVSAILLLLVAGAVAILSSPPVMARLSRATKDLEERSEAGIEEDGSIKVE